MIQTPSFSTGWLSSQVHLQYCLINLASRYHPSLPAATVFIVFFSITTALHIFQAAKYRSKFFIPFIIGGFCKYKFRLNCNARYQLFCSLSDENFGTASACRRYPRDQLLLQSEWLDLACGAFVEASVLWN